MTKVFLSTNDYAVSKMFAAYGYGLVDRIEYADLVIFNGGADVDPSLYGEESTHSHTDPEHDKADLAAWEASEGKYRVGICRGGQFLNVMNGGKLRQHIDGHSMGFQECYAVGPTGDPVPGPDGGLLKYSLHEDHHQEILPTPIGRVFLSALKDNVCEGVYYQKTKSFCFQPHPEWGHEETKKVFFRYLHYFTQH